MKKPIRVMVVDDSIVIRRQIMKVLGEEDDIEIVGDAPNGRRFLDGVEACNPNVVVLDIEMPVMSGIEAMREFRKVDRRTAVIMFSTLTERGAKATLEALVAGATDYVAKPSRAGSIEQARDYVRQNLLPRIRTLGGRVGRRAGGAARKADRGGGPASADRPRAKLATHRSRPVGGRVDIVAIGVSTGGPEALGQVIPRLPASFPVPVVVVQHMPPVFTRILADRLDSKSAVSVCEAEDGMVLEAGHVYFAPGGRHLVVKRRGTVITASLNDDPPEHSCRPSVDRLFRSVAEVFDGHAVAIVLTGMGLDGEGGCRAIGEKGGEIIVQDEESSVVWGMPGAVAGAGLAHSILPIAEIAPTLVRHLTAARGARTAGGTR